MKILVSKGIPSSNSNYKARSGGRGQIVSINGQILYTSSLPVEPTTMHGLLGTSDALDLEDDSDTFTAIFSNLKFRKDVEKPKRIYYIATFMEQDNPS